QRAVDLEKGEESGHIPGRRRRDLAAVRHTPCRCHAAGNDTKPTRQYSPQTHAAFYIPTLRNRRVLTGGITPAAAPSANSSSIARRPSLPKSSEYSLTYKSMCLYITSSLISCACSRTKGRLASRLAKANSTLRRITRFTRSWTSEGSDRRTTIPPSGMGALVVRSQNSPRSRIFFNPFAAYVKRFS